MGRHDQTRFLQSHPQAAEASRVAVLCAHPALCPTQRRSRARFPPQAAAAHTAGPRGPHRLRRRAFFSCLFTGRPDLFTVAWLLWTDFRHSRKGVFTPSVAAWCLALTVAPDWHLVPRGTAAAADPSCKHLRCSTARTRTWKSSIDSRGTPRATSRCTMQQLVVSSLGLE